MQVLITGGAGFLGKRLGQTLLARGSIAVNGNSNREISNLVFFDKVAVTDLPSDARVKVITGDISDNATQNSLLDTRFDVIFHLAAIVSGEAESNFDLGMQVNLDATRYMLEHCRHLDYSPVFVFASSCAVFGGDFDMIIRDDTATTPLTSYGTQKAISGLLINDYSRRGFLNGRSLRLPTIAIRPGKPNAAASSFVSGIIREPLNGEKALCPVSRDTEVWILSPSKVIDNFIHAAEITESSLGTDRMITLPGLTTSVDEMVNTLEQLAGKETTDFIDFTPDPFIQSIAMTWPGNFQPQRSKELGFKWNDSVREVIQEYIDDELDGRRPW